MSEREEFSWLKGERKDSATSRHYFDDEAMHYAVLAKVHKLRSILALVASKISNAQATIEYVRPPVGVRTKKEGTLTEDESFLEEMLLGAMLALEDAKHNIAGCEIGYGANVCEKADKEKGCSA